MRELPPLVSTVGAVTVDDGSGAAATLPVPVGIVEETDGAAMDGTVFLGGVVGVLFAASVASSNSSIAQAFDVSGLHVRALGTLLDLFVLGCWLGSVFLCALNDGPPIVDDDLNALRPPPPLWFEK